MAVAGLWDSVPVGKAWDGSQIGIQTTRGQALDASPICLLRAKHSEANLLADVPRDFLAAYIAQRILLKGAGPWDALHDRPDGEWEDLGTCCVQESEDIRRIRAALADPRLRTEVAGLPGRGDDFRVPFGDMLARTCASPARLAFHRFVDQFVTARLFTAEPTEQMGVWRSIADLSSIDLLPEGEWKQRAVLRVLRLPWAHSGARRGMSPTWGAWGIAASHRGGLHHAALALQAEIQSGRLVPTDHPADEPLITATMAYVAAGEHSYDGQAHVDAAGILAERGDWEGALSAHRTAAFWQRQRFRATPVETLAAFVQGTAEAGPPYAAMHEVAQRHLDVLADELARRGKT